MPRKKITNKDIYEKLEKMERVNTFNGILLVFYSIMFATIGIYFATQNPYYLFLAIVIYFISLGLSIHFSKILKKKKK